MNVEENRMAHTRRETREKAKKAKRFVAQENVVSSSQKLMEVSEKESESE